MGGHYNGHFATNTRGNCNFLPKFEVKVTVQNISTAATSNIFIWSDYYERNTASKCGPCCSLSPGPYHLTHPGLGQGAKHTSWVRSEIARYRDTREFICCIIGWWDLHLSPTVTSHYWQECHNTAGAGEAGGWWGVNCDGPVSRSSPAPGRGYNVL